VIDRQLVCVLTTFLPFLDLQNATIIEQIVGLLSSSAEDNLLRLDDANRNVHEEGSAVFVIKSNYSNTTRVVHVNSNLLMSIQISHHVTEPPNPSHEDLTSLLLNISIHLITIHFIPPNAHRSAGWFSTPGRNRTERER
jgi:hypothetical protein